MTLRYTQIADETVGREYHEALARVTGRYQLARPDEPIERDPVDVLQDVIRWIQKHLHRGQAESRGRLLVRRLEAAREELREMQESASALSSPNARRDWRRDGRPPR